MPRADDDGQRGKHTSRRRKGRAIPTPKAGNPIRLREQLCDDMLTEILVRLPAKSLTRFKSVCKKWFSIISSDYFCHQHTLRRPKLQPSLILELGFIEYFYFNPITFTTTNDHEKKKKKKKTTTKKKMIIPYNDSGSHELVPGCRIVQACNGLMLLRFGDPGYCETVTVYDPTTERFIENTITRGGYCVYNLTTRQSRMIFLTHNPKYPYVEGVTLAFDPSKSPYYKIVCIRSTDEYGDPTHYRVEVYDSESHTWKLGLDAFTSPTVLFSSDGTYWNNGIYWETYDGDSYCWFDIEENEMKTLYSPHPATSRLQESNGHLYSYSVESEKVVVWELGVDDDHRPQWLFRYKNFVRKWTDDRILRLMGRSDEDESTCKMLIHEAGKIWTYNFLDETYKHPLDLKIQPCYQPITGYFHVTGFHFAETLALV